MTKIAMRNDLYELIMDHVHDAISEWWKDHPDHEMIHVAHQLNMVAVELRRLGAKAEEEYKKGIGK